MRGDQVGVSDIVGACLATLVLASATCLGAFSWRTFHQPPAPIGVVIITLDTTRADRLSVYGFMDAAMPHLERLGREGIVFDRATSVAPLTLPAHCSLFTGLYPPAHGVRDNADRPLSPEHTTLAETLRAHGFRTGAFVGSVVLDADRGLAQGFDRYSGVADVDASAGVTMPRRQRPADEVVTDAIRWIDGIHGSRFFAWVHLYDPHRPYDPPEPFRSKYADPYIGEIAFADSQIGRLLEALERRNVLDRTVIVVAADHGESQGDHGERDHGVFVYESVLRVPLIIRSPNVSPRRIADVVRLVDIMPTVLDLVGVRSPAVDGVSLVRMVRGDSQQADLDAYSESQYPLRLGWSPLRALHAGRYKLIEAPRPELYDLDRDPFEQRNIYDERRDVARALAQRLTAFERGSAAPRNDGNASTSAAEVQERIASLGYIGSGAARAPSEHEDLPDPKDCIGVFSSGGRRPTSAAATRCGVIDGPVSRTTGSTSLR
jgi:arylsulfatase A-like enzyme